MESSNATRWYYIVVFERQDLKIADQSAIKLKNKKIQKYTKKKERILEIIIKNHEIAQNAASLEDRAAPQQEGINSRTGSFSRKNKSCTGK